MKWLLGNFRRRLVALIWAGLIVASLFSSAVQAECGDYVIIGRAGLHKPLGLSPFRSQTGLTGHYTARQPMSAPVGQPCIGPGCHRGRPAPIPFSGVATDSMSQWLCLESPSPRALPSSTDLIIATGVARTTQRPEPIEPPPRVA
jgi:hypothetical protein